MNEEVGRLLDVQAIDIQLAELEDRREEVPRRRAEVSSEITALEREREERLERVERARLERRAKEGELEATQQRLERYEKQLNDVKTNVAYSALLTEIQSAKREISAAEEEILTHMERRETEEARIAEIERELEEKRAAAADELEALDAEMSDLQSRVEATRAKRDAEARAIDERLYRMYDRLRRGRRFPALVPLRGGACGACFGKLPPQVIREITHDGALHPCEACGVLVYAEQVPAESSADGSGGAG